MGRFDDELKATAIAVATPGKGILAADESTNTIGARFSKIGVENNEPNRRAYRDLLFNTPGVGQFLSGAILYEETLFQRAEDNTPFPEVLKRQGIIVGIKVDKGTVVIPGTDNETSTQGLDGLAERCQRYYEAGARFAKWRAVLKISPNGCPSALAIQENAWGLARYAAICQANGLVPIVEPEVLMDGSHSIEVAAAVTEKVLASVFKALSDNNILLEGILLKPNMVCAGTDFQPQPGPEAVARFTVQTLLRTVPAAVPGIMFLSGGQTELEATANLHHMNLLPKRPWTLSFSYGRALQSSVQKAWKGDANNVQAAREVLVQRARANSQATLGRYEGEQATKDASESLHIKDYKY